MLCPNCGFNNQDGIAFCQNCGVPFSQNPGTSQSQINTAETTKPKKSKKKIVIAIVSVFLALSLIVVTVASVAVIELFSYRCSDCGKFVIFEEHTIMSEDGTNERWVCNQCHNNWMSEEYGVTFSGERVYS